jgi:hypothetical protein
MKPWVHDTDFQINLVTAPIPLFHNVQPVVPWPSPSAHWVMFIYVEAIGTKIIITNMP